jgi:ribosomal protein L20
MPRSVNSVKRARRKKMKQATKVSLDAKRLTVAKNAVEKARFMLYREKVKRENFRALWIMRIN